ncbi:hypothetical protein EGR_06536 [Echinococcus granulosus]|uniref:Uncharacterized protein n=1 Tax=Echinococcus granulosus TaxID=6210 RepID=W6UYB2_ECHGR|nr:hypothetical protein EGR_06536 [Echinococcus granulosus]EUB58549.1 hypothetical protein EGR_06536 [Echinococcus granulosus]
MSRLIPFFGPAKVKAIGVNFYEEIKLISTVSCFIHKKSIYSQLLLQARLKQKSSTIHPHSFGLINQHPMDSILLLFKMDALNLYRRGHFLNFEIAFDT